jgi:selenocysteine-specific elongation factor
VQAGRLLEIGRGIYVAAGAPERALARLSALDQPFTVSAATRALASSRRVVVPLLEHLDAARKTRRLADGTRFLVGGAG